VDNFTAAAAVTAATITPAAVAAAATATATPAVAAVDAFSAKDAFSIKDAAVTKDAAIDSLVDVYIRIHETRRYSLTPQPCHAPLPIRNRIGNHGNSPIAARVLFRDHADKDYSDKGNEDEYFGTVPFDHCRVITAVLRDMGIRCSRPFKVGVIQHSAFNVASVTVLISKTGLGKTATLLGVGLLR
jgi:hypothetical protein